MSKFRLPHIIISVLVVNVAIVLCSMAMMLIPGTPHRRSLEVMMQLAAYPKFEDLGRAQQDSANAAFDEFVRLGNQARWVEAAVIPVVAGIVTLVIWRKTLPLSAIEIVVITAGYAAGVMWRFGSLEVELPMVVGVALLGATVALSHSPLISRRRHGLPAGL